MKEDNEKLSEALFKLCETSLDSIQKLTYSTLKFYEYSYKTLERELQYLNETEPSRIFKKKHKAWENEIEKIKKEQQDVLKKIEKEYKNLKQ